jgi:DNA-binding MarR family transcriptional regulator
VDGRADQPTDAELVSWWGLVLEGFTTTMRSVAAEVEAATGLGQAPAEVMLRLGRTPGGRLPMSRIARESSLSSGGFTKVADKLAALGHVRRVPCDDDRRVTYVELTLQGRTLADAIEARTAESLRERLLGTLEPAQARELGELMRHLRDAG